MRQRKVSIAAEREQAVREFKPPELNDMAIQLQDLLPNIDECVFEPPLTTYLSTEDLDNIVDVPFTVYIPSHSQGVERCVKMVLKRPDQCRERKPETTIYGQ